MHLGEPPTLRVREGHASARRQGRRATNAATPPTKPLRSGGTRVSRATAPAEIETLAQTRAPTLGEDKEIKKIRIKKRLLDRGYADTKQRCSAPTKERVGLRSGAGPTLKLDECVCGSARPLAGRRPFAPSPASRRFSITLRCPFGFGCLRSRVLFPAGSDGIPGRGSWHATFCSCYYPTHRRSRSLTGCSFRLLSVGEEHSSLAAICPRELDSIDTIRSVFLAHFFCRMHALVVHLPFMGMGIVSAQGDPRWD